MSNQDRILKPDEEQKRNKLKREKPRVYEKVLKFEEKLKRGESIAIIQFQYNYMCNFHCVHCDIKKMERRERSFTPKDVREFSNQADELGLAHWVITGGEPLIFPDFDQIVEAIDPSKFYITTDTNGWFLDEERAKHLKSIGVDKIQLSLDSLDRKAHDEFRRKPGSYDRCMRAIEAAKKADLNIIVQTVVWRGRARSREFKDFLKFLNDMGVPVFVTFAKPVGEWQGNMECLVTPEEIEYVRSLEKEHDVFTHWTPAYGLDIGCIAVKRMISVTQYGDIMPCPYIHVSLGNFFKEPLKDIIERGLNIKYFGQYYSGCWIAGNREFIEKYIVRRVDGKPLPVPYTEVFDESDFITKEQRQLLRP